MDPTTSETFAHALRARTIDAGPFWGPGSGAKVNSLPLIKSKLSQRPTNPVPNGRSHRGPENSGLENAKSAPSAGQAVTSPAAITFENNENSSPSAGAEKQFRWAGGGGKGTAVEPSLPRKLWILNDFAGMNEIGRVSFRRDGAPRRLQVPRRHRG